MKKLTGLCLFALIAITGCYYDPIIPASREPSLVPLVSSLREPVAAQPTAPMTVQQDASSLQQRFTGSQTVDPVMTITMWAQRYDELLKQTEQLRLDNTKMLEENNRLKQELNTLKADLTQTRRDVEQSNTLLQEAHVELSKWKADVLGFRDEMRQAQTAQMTALGRILRILGAESALPQKESTGQSLPQEGMK